MQLIERVGGKTSKKVGKGKTVVIIWENVIGDEEISIQPFQGRGDSNICQNLLVKSKSKIYLQHTHITIQYIQI